MTKEQIYTAQLQALGIYEPAFDPEIKTLSQLERELTRCQKEWKKTAPNKDTPPSMTHELYSVIQGLRKEILQHREALGLTPKALRKLKGAQAAPVASAQSTLSNLLDAIKERSCEQP